jgi:hypothetical protein
VGRDETGERIGERGGDDSSRRVSSRGGSGSSGYGGGSCVRSRRGTEWRSGGGRAGASEGRPWLHLRRSRHPLCGQRQRRRGRGRDGGRIYILYTIQGLGPAANLIVVFH